MGMPLHNFYSAQRPTCPGLICRAPVDLGFGRRGSVPIHVQQHSCRQSLPPPSSSSASSTPEWALLFAQLLIRQWCASTQYLTALAHSCRAVTRASHRDHAR